MVKRGIDISSHQGNIDLEKLKDQIDFAIIRVGYGPKGAIDNKFERNADLCGELGIPVGFYWYSYALTEADAEKEAAAFLKAIAPYKPTYGCWFDMEDADKYKQRNGMPLPSTLRAICAKWCKIVEGAGYYAGVYASQSWFDNQLKGDELTRYDKWVALWPTYNKKQKGLSVDPSSRTGLSMWQFTSVGRLSGYNGNLDVNYAYHEFPNPKDKITAKPVAEEKPKPKPVAKPKANPIIKGSKVKFTGKKSYSGIPLADWTNGYVFDVIEISGDRLVIGKGTAVTAAVNIRDCKKI